MESVRYLQHNMYLLAKGEKKCNMIREGYNTQRDTCWIQGHGNRCSPCVKASMGKEVGKKNLEARSTKDTDSGSGPRNVFVEVIKESPRLLKGKKPLNVDEVTSMAKINGSPSGGRLHRHERCQTYPPLHKQNAQHHCLLWRKRNLVELSSLFLYKVQTMMRQIPGGGPDGNWVLSCN